MAARKSSNTEVRSLIRRSTMSRWTHWLTFSVSTRSAINRRVRERQPRLPAWSAKCASTWTVWATFPWCPCLRFSTDEGTLRQLRHLRQFQRRA